MSSSDSEYLSNLARVCPCQHHIPAESLASALLSLTGRRFISVDQLDLCVPLSRVRRVFRAQAAVLESCLTLLSPPGHERQRCHPSMQRCTQALAHLENHRP